MFSSNGFGVAGDPASAARASASSVIVAGMAEDLPIRNLQPGLGLFVRGMVRISALLGEL
jgi:hypothetical protein